MSAGCYAILEIDDAALLVAESVTRRCCRVGKMVSDG
jgi:hypothetical protein